MAGNQDGLPKYTKVQTAVHDTTSRPKETSKPWGFDRNRSCFWMILSLLSGVALTVGHHFFYARFDGQPVDEASIDQTWIIRIGTVFAFVAKTLLVVAASIAFIQHQWLTLSRNPLKIRQIDTVTGILGNALSFCESRIWLRFPLLTMLAIVTCLLPIAAVVTPATINVVARDDITSSDSAPPQLYLDPNSYGNLQTLVRSDYIGPSPDTLRTAYGSAMTGQILGITQANPNMTYTLQFLGPALRCDHADAALVSDVYDSYMDYFTGIENQYYYMAWVPISDDRGNLSRAFGDDAASLDTVSTDAAHLYIIPNTSITGPMFVGGMPITSDDMHYGYQDLLDCSLHNASYKVFFNFTFPTQSIDVVSRELLNPVNVSIDISEWQRSTGPPDVTARQAQRISYQSIMDSFGRLLAGYEWSRDGFVVTEKTSWNMIAIDWTTRDGTQRGLEQLFQNITLSMLGTSSLTQNQVPVSVITSVNVYSYDPRDLWLAYGVACGATLVSTLLGLYAMWRNGGVGYQSIFSTYIRTTRNQALQDLIEQDDHGTEPLPKKLAETSIILDT